MGNVTLRELRTDSRKIWDRLEAGEEMVIMRKGQPFALLLPTTLADIEPTLRACRAARIGTALDRMTALAQANGLVAITDEAIEAEISEVRLQQRHLWSGIGPDGAERLES